VTALKSSPNEEVRGVGAELEDSTVEALEGVRRLALELRPPALDDLGLADALARPRAAVPDSVAHRHRLPGDRVTQSPAGRHRARPVPGRPGGVDQRRQARPRPDRLNGSRPHPAGRFNLDPRRRPGASTPS
jgi:hypothetical protein